jgi:acetylornithine deacetylase
MAQGDVVDSLAAAIDRDWERQLQWLQHLVRFPSLRGQEGECQEWLAGEFAARGWSVDRYALADIDFSQHAKSAPVVETDYARAQQVVASVAAPDPKGRSLILQGHVDVVPAGPPDMWTAGPFEPVIKNGLMYGRGSCDMKAGVSCLVFALDAIRAAGFRPDADVFVQTVTEEESTGNGALSTILRGYRAEAVIIPEPSANRITRAHVGAMWFRLKVRGTPVHVANSDTGTNAIMATFRLLAAIEALTARINARASETPAFGIVPDPVKFNPGVIRGGDWPSSTAAWCEVDCRIGLLPGTEVASAQAELSAAILEAARRDPLLADTPPEIEWTGFLADGYVLEPGSDAECCLAAAHQKVFDEPMGERRSTAVNDTRYYGLYAGIPSLCYGPKGVMMHGFDEAVDLESVKRTTLVIATFITDWCGLRPL